MKQARHLCLLAIWLLYLSLGYGQADSAITRNLPVSPSVLDRLSISAARQKQLLVDGTLDYLGRLARQEDRLLAKVAAMDSLKAVRLSAGAGYTYRQWMQKLQSITATGNSESGRQYMPGIDSLLTGLAFLREHPGLLSPGTSMASLENAYGQLKQLQERFFLVNNIQQWSKARVDFLRTQLSQPQFAKGLLGMNKNMYYYQQQLSQYQGLWNDRQKLAQTVLAAVRGVPAFQPYFQKYSYLSRLFPVPSGLGTEQALQGLQSRADIQRNLQQVAAQAGAGSDPGKYLQQQAESGQQALDVLKSRTRALGVNSGSGDMVMPDFIPDHQKGRSFLHRLEPGFSLQNAGSNGLLPVTSNIAATLGYRLSDKMTMGVGAGFLLGWGNQLSAIKLSSQGLNFRSYVDVKAKGGWWVTGGFEYDYLQALSDLSDVPNLDVWQKSALIGLTKKYSIGKRGGSLQLLYDLLYAQQVPHGQPLRFRIGFNL